MPSSLVIRSRSEGKGAKKTFCDKNIEETFLEAGRKVQCIINKTKNYSIFVGHPRDNF